MGLSVNSKQKVRQAMVKISRGGNHPPPPLPWQDILAEMAWPSEGEEQKLYFTHNALQEMHFKFQKATSEEN